MIKLEYHQSREINKLIRRECCNCAEGNCILLDDACVQLNSSKYIYCNHFLRAVLPLDKSLYAELCSDNKKRCEVCEKYFIPRNNRQKYCDNCSPSRRNDYMKNYMRKKRDKC
jgi:hypothetical protein